MSDPRFALALLGLLAASPAHAECARFGLDPKIVTAAGATLPPTGGILIATEATRTGSLAAGDVVLQTTWRFKGSKAAPAVVSLAPGLAVMRVPDGKAELVDDAGKSLIAVTGVARSRWENKLAAIDPPAAPKVKAVRAVLRDMGYRGSSNTVTAELDKLPADATAVILFDAKTKKPRSWGLIDDALPTVTVYWVGRCTPLPNGTLATGVGDWATVAYVDTSGRISAPSAAIKVTKELPAKP